ncbi:MAG TPA: S9 family peptidase [Blastocatellia bacterium]|nr:S9 family peptidase [Blastocatellia bacterium]
MKARSHLPIRSAFTLLVVLCFTLTAGVATAQTPGNQPKRPMTFMDIMEMRSVGSPAISPDGRQMLYTLSAPDWKAAKSFTDIYLVSLDEGLTSTRQMTFTKDKNETSPKWSRDGKFFVFASNREAPAAGSPAAATPASQLYLMRPDGGEARRITNAKDGVGTFALSRDGKWLAFSAGKEEEQQIWIIPVAGIESESPKQLTRHATPVTSWQFSPDSKSILFLSPDSFDKDNKERREKKFDVRIRNEETPLVRLWSFELAAKKEALLTPGGDYSVGSFTISKDAKWVAFSASPKDRYLRNITDASDYADLYLLETGSGRIERLTNNRDIAESLPVFSPDSRLIAFSAADDFQFFHSTRVYVRAVADAGGRWRKLGSDFGDDIRPGFWSQDGKTIYFNGGIGATEQLFAISTETGKTTQLTHEKAALLVSQDEDTQKLIINYSDPVRPANIYTASIDQIANRAVWKQLTDSNPQVAGLALGETEAIQWKSSDGKMVEGILVKPVGYEKGKRYPLIVQIHGGPQSADVLRFNGGYGNYSHVFAGAGYACLLPNYRGSTNYGEAFKMQIGGDYFRQGYEDIMAGVDHLISTGLADGDRMGVMGWSAGGHWSNWILTHTTRFKAISTGAGAMNWISMYAQTDTQRVREFYYGGRPPYDDFDKWWDVSPLKYIKNAKTPTLIHVVDGDPRVPRPQSEELHMALKKLGVPTEFFVYPGNTHGIPDPRNQMVKMVAEFNWFEKWIKGKDKWFEWKELLSTVKDEKPEAQKSQPAEGPKEPE